MKKIIVCIISISLLCIMVCNASESFSVKTFLDSTTFLTNDGKLITTAPVEKDTVYYVYATDVASIIDEDENRIKVIRTTDGHVIVAHEYGWIPNYEIDDEWDDAVLVAADLDFAVGLKSDGTWISAGEYRNGECDVDNWTDIVAIDIGNHYTVGLKSNGTVVATGLNDKGQCNVSKWTDIVMIDADWKTTLGLKSDGTVVATGDDEENQCFVKRWKNVISIKTSMHGSMGLTSDGKVVTTSDKATSAINRTIPDDYSFQDMVRWFGWVDEKTGFLAIVNRDGTIDTFGDDWSYKNETKPRMDAIIRGDGVDWNGEEFGRSHAEKTYSESECQKIATDYLKQFLKNPNSLQIHNITSEASDDQYQFTFDYSAMNSFGGYTRSTYICIVSIKTGEVINAYSY